MFSSGNANNKELLGFQKGDQATKVLVVCKGRDEEIHWTYCHELMSDSNNEQQFLKYIIKILLHYYFD